MVRRSAGKRKDAGFDSLLRLTFLFKNLRFMDAVSIVTLPCTINDILKWLSSLPHPKAEIILVVTV